MSLLFAFSVSDPDRIRCALYPHRAAFRASAQQAKAGWGLAFYQGDEILLKRRPLAGDGRVDFYEMAKELRTDVLLGHVGEGAASVRTENVSPFRFRQWLGAHSGTIPHFEEARQELLASTPDFLRRSIRGKTESEHLFHLVLAFLHDAGKLDDPRATAETLADAIRAAVRFVDRAAAAHTTVDDADSAPANFILTNGRVIAALRRGQPLVVLRRTGIAQCPVCLKQQTHLGRGSRAVSHELLRSVLLLSDREIGAETGGEEIPDGSLALVDRNLNVTTQLL